MSKKVKHNPPKDPNIHIIGNKFTEKDNEIINAAVQAIIEKVEPILNGIGGMVDAMDKRLAIVEEVKKIFPDKVEVTVKHEYPKISVPHTIAGAELEGEIDKEIFKKYESIIEDKKKKKEKK